MRRDNIFGKYRKRLQAFCSAAGLAVLLFVVSGTTIYCLVNGWIPFAVETAATVETAEEGSDIAEDKTDQEGKRDAKEFTEFAEEMQDGKTLLVAVPTEDMSLRHSPGFGTDVITKVYAGTYLSWEGELETVDGADFYKVAIKDTKEEGYLAAKYCVRVEFTGDEKELSVVNVNSAEYTYRQMAEDINSLCETYPDRLKSMEIGKSVDGRTIYAVILGNPQAKQKVMVQAAMHGREYMTTQLVMRMLEYYAYYYEEGRYGKTSYEELFGDTAFYVVPMANPDGVTISQLGADALSDQKLKEQVYDCYLRDRKDPNSEAYGRDFSSYQSIWKANANGVDLNKNFDAGWDVVGRKSLPSYENYKGIEAVSEPEAKALEKFAKSQNFDTFLNYHSKGQIIYYGAKGSPAESAAASKELANLLADKVRYLPVNTVKNSYVSLGGFGDWAQLKLEKPSVTIETGKNACPLSIDEFPAMWFRNRESWAYLSKQLSR